MRSAEPLDPDVVAALDAIDATLAGEPVDPEFAELAELSLILREERAEPDLAFLGRLDRQVSRRFAAPAGAAGSKARRGRWLRRPAWAHASWAPAFAIVVALVIVVGIVGGVVGTHHDTDHLLAVHPTSRSAASSGASSSGASSSGASGAATVGSSASAGAGAGAGAAGGSSAAPSAAATTSQRAAKVPAVPPSPHSGAHRDVAQSAQLALRAGAGRIDPVAQEVFDVIGAERGIVMSSHVTESAGAPGFAQFELSVPSGRLEATLRRLSALRGARVLSREDASTDITAQIGGAGTRLADARALRRSLLHQLAAAYTTAQIDHVQALLRRNESAIAGDETALARLRGRVSDSTIAVTLTAPAPVHHRHHRSGSGFTLHRALHDAGHVLLVAAGVLLIAVAVLIPLALVVALIAWVWALSLRRRREGALGP